MINDSSNYDFFYQAMSEINLDCKIDKIEFLTIINYIKKYITPEMKVLEINAANGRYTRYLHSKGYDVTATEENKTNIKRFKSLTPNTDIPIFNMSSTKLVKLPDASYDMVLLLYPFKANPTDKKKTKIFKEALRVLKPKGLIYSIHEFNDISIMENCFSMDSLDGLKEITGKDVYDFDLPIESIFNFYRKENLDEFMNQFNTIRLHLVSLDLLSKSFLKPQLAEMDTEAFKVYFKYFSSICERPDMIGMSNFVLDISQKLE